MGEPLKRLGPKTEAPHDKECKEIQAIVRPKVFYHKKWKQDVLLWLINNRIEDVEDYSANGTRWRDDAAPGFEKEPRSMPDGSKKWFRGPTYVEAANIWKIPVETIAHWWNEREKIFEGAVPESAVTLVHSSQRHGPTTTRPPTPDSSGPWPRSAGLPSHTGLAAWQSQPPAPHSQHPGPRLAAAPVVYPQAIQPVGPPLHPLYRANFAVGEVSHEVSHMIQNQQNIHLENLLRAIALSQALVNDLTEAHKVLLDPRTYPQYYPGVCAQPARHEPRPGPPLHPPHVQHPPGPYSRTQDGRYIAIQPAPNQVQPLTPVHTPSTQTFPQQQYHHPLPHQTGQQAGQYTWRLSSKVSGSTANPPSQPCGRQPLRPAEEAAANLECSARRKRSYRSKDGPGGTAESAVILENDVKAGNHDASTCGEKRMRASGVGANGNTAVGDRPDEGGVSGTAISVARAPDGTRAREDKEVSIDQRGKPVVDADHASKQGGPTTAEHELEAEQQDQSKDAGGNGRDHEKLHDDSDKNGANDDIISDTGNGIQSQASQCTVSEAGHRMGVGKAVVAEPTTSSPEVVKMTIDR